MAMVYEAEDLLLGRKVAVKVLREQFAADPGFLERFQREAKAAAALSHPNVVAIYDVGSDGPTQYIVMELVKGRTLKEMIQEEGPLSSARIIDLGRQVCEGLEYAHEHGIVHRDVKAQNILVGRDGRAKIADFGIAVALGTSSLTQSGHIVGSVQYISPEQAQGEPVTALSDLYSAGVVLYEMAAGRLPFEGETPVTVALKQVQDDPLPPRQVNPRIPESLQAVILRALAKEPARRFRSGREMADALLACARSSLEATISQPVPVPPGAVRTGRGNGAVVRETVRPARPSRPVRKQDSGGWTALLLVLVILLLVLGTIPLAILAYSNGSLQRLFPALTGVSVGTTAPTPLPSGEPTAVATSVPSSVPAPQFVGRSFPDALKEAQALGLDLVMAGEAYSSEYPVAYVVAQKPASGTAMEKGGQIEVTISKGREIGTVPKVVGDSAPSAEGKLQAAGFPGWKIVEEWSEQVPAGVVMAQNPVGDSRLEKGSEVVLTVSKGREKVAVPNLVGRPEAEAQDAIKNAGLTPTWVNYQDYTTVPPGAVISQEPKAGTMVEKGTTVYIAVRRMDSPTQPPPPAKKP